MVKEETCLFCDLNAPPDIPKYDMEWTWRVPARYQNKRTTRNAKRFQMPNSGFVSLHSAAEIGASFDIEYILETYKECNVDQTDRRGLTALHLAARHGYSAACRVLIKYDANVLQESKTSKSNIIHMVATSGNLQLTEEICSIISSRWGDDRLKAMVCCDNQHGKLPAHCAAQSGNTALFDYLYNFDTAHHHRNKTSDGRTFALLAAERGHRTMVEHLKKLKLVAQESLTALYHNIVHHAARSGNRELLKYVVKEMSLRCSRANPFKPNVFGMTPIFAAAESQYTEVVEYLLQPPRELDLNVFLPSSCITPLSKAAQSGSLPMVQFLISRGAQVKLPCAKPLLHIAAQGGNVDMVKWLLENHSLSDELSVVSSAVGAYPKNIFHYAVENGDDTMIKYLCETILPAQPSLQSLLLSEKNSPLEIACDCGNFGAVKYLVRKKLFSCSADIVLLRAVEARYLDIVQFLLHELFPIGKSQPPQELLHLLAQWCNDTEFLKVDIIQQRGYNVLANVDGRSVLFDALRKDNSDLVRMLLTDEDLPVPSNSEQREFLLHAAALGGNLESTKVLVDTIPEVVLQKTEKFASIIGSVFPFHLAVVSQSLELIQFFVEELGCSATATADNRLSALHIAAADSYRNQVPIIEYLIRVGYQSLFEKVHTFPKAPGTDLTPHDVASSNEIRVLLEKYTPSKLAERFLVPFDRIDVEMNSSFGRGKNATVFRGTYRLTPVAVKILVQSRKQPLYKLMQEIGIMASIRHRNLCTLEAASIVDDKIYLVMEPLKKSLKDYIEELSRENSAFPLDELKSIAIDICLGMNALHCNDPPVCHLDLKMANILLNAHGEAKIADFGISKFEFLRESTEVYKFILPPEYNEEKVFSTLGDIYAFGLCLMNMLLCSTARVQKENHYFTTNLFQFNSIVSNAFLDIVRRSCAYDPQDRFQSFAEIIPLLRAVEMQPEVQLCRKKEDTINILVQKQEEFITIQNDELPIVYSNPIPSPLPNSGYEGTPGDGGYCDID